MNPSDFECETEEEHEADDVSTTERRSYTFDPYGPTRQQMDMTRRDVSSYMVNLIVILQGLGIIKGLYRVIQRARMRNM